MPMDVCPRSVVQELNQEIFDRLGEEFAREGIGLVYHSDGSTERISLGEAEIWSDEEDSGRWPDDGGDPESLKSWVRKKIAERVRLLGKLLVLTEPVKE